MKHHRLTASDNDGGPCTSKLQSEDYRHTASQSLTGLKKVNGVFTPICKRSVTARGNGERGHSCPSKLRKPFDGRSAFSTGNARACTALPRERRDNQPAFS